jgi:hypothetical protein
MVETNTFLTNTLLKWLNATVDLKGNELRNCLLSENSSRISTKDFESIYFILLQMRAILYLKDSAFYSGEIFWKEIAFFDDGGSIDWMSWKVIVANLCLI